MKKVLQIFLVLLISSTGFSQNTNSEDSCTGNMKYYAISNTNIYEGMNTSSTIVSEVPQGEEVIVLSTFFSDHGWFKICYKGINGHAEKANLSDTRTSARTVRNAENIDNRSVGFSPFLARTTTTLNFRNGPSSRSIKIRSVRDGSSMFVYSNRHINDYYKSIDVTTGQIGWVHKGYVRRYQTVALNDESDFKNTGYTGSQTPELLVTNTSTQARILVLGDEIISLGANSSRSIKVAAGREYYIAIKPGLIPTAGFQTFEPNTEYKLEL